MNFKKKKRRKELSKLDEQEVTSQLEEMGRGLIEKE